MEDVSSYVGFPIALTVFLALLKLSGVDMPMWVVLAPLTLLACALTVVWFLALVLDVRDKVRTKNLVDKP